VRFAAILGTRDDGDILPRSLAQLRRIGVELIIVLDHGSTDETPSWLTRAQTADHVWVVSAPSDAAAVSGPRLRATLARSSGAEWVIFPAADELWLPNGGSLHGLAELADADILSVPRYNVVLGSDGPLLAPPPQPVEGDETLVYALPTGEGAGDRAMGDQDGVIIRAAMAPKVMARPEAIAVLGPGDRDLEANAHQPWRRGIARDMIIAHVPLRSPEQFERAVSHARDAVTSSPDPPAVADPWHERLATIAATGRAREEFERQAIGPTEVDRLRSLGVIRSAAQVLERPVPPLATEEQYLAVVGSAQPWLTVAGQICRREGIQPQGRLRHLATAHRPTVIVPPDHVIKLYAPWRNGMLALEREVSALRLMTRDADLPVPRILAHGAIDDDWQYVVLSRLRGRALSDVREELAPDELARTVAWLGRFVRRLHGIPLSPDEREAGWSRFREEITWRHAKAAGIMTHRHGLPARLVAQVDEWLPPLDTFLGTAEDVVLTHGDLIDAHVLGTVTEGHFAPGGVLDFGEALLGHPLYDLGPAWWCILRGERDLLATFLSAAGLPGTDTPDFARLALAWSIMHPCWDLPELPAAEAAEDLDDLALRLFGSLEVRMT
jgi:hygromycin-B 7''-O-kinase